MDNICYIDNCHRVGKFNCSCNPKLIFCQEHIADHISDSNFHEISVSKIDQSRANQKVNEAIISLNNLNTMTLTKGKEMFKELFDQLCNVIDNLSQRQQSLIELSSSSNSKNIEEKIKELETVNIAFREKGDFKNLLKNFMSTEQFQLDTPGFYEFRKDFKLIVESLEKSNEVIQVVAASHKKEQEIIENLENRIFKLENNNIKIENIDQRLKKFDTDNRNNSSLLEKVKKNLEKNTRDSREAQKMFNDKFIEAQQRAKQQLEQIQALENNISKAVEQNSKNLNEKIFGFSEKLKKTDFQIEEMKKKGIIKKAEKIRIQNEEAKMKRIQDLDEAKRLAEIRRVNSLSYREKVQYYLPIMTNFRDINYCCKHLTQLLTSNDGKYLFACIRYLDCKNNKGGRNYQGTK